MHHATLMAQVIYNGGFQLQDPSFLTLNQILSFYMSFQYLFCYWNSGDLLLQEMKIVYISNKLYISAAEDCATRGFYIKSAVSGKCIFTGIVLKMSFAKATFLGPGRIHSDQHEQLRNKIKDQYACLMCTFSHSTQNIF